MRLCDLPRPRLERWFGELRASGASVGVSNAALRDLSAVLGATVADGLLPANPAVGIRRYRVETVREPPAVGPVGLELLRAALLPSMRNVVLVELVGLAAMRPGEAAALRWEDVRPNGLYVDESWSENELKPPKSWRERLVVDVAAGLRADLDSLRPPDADPAAFVCPARSGKPLDLRGWAVRVLKPAAEAAGLPGLTLRSLRHTAASMWVAEGRPLTYVQSQLGHGSLQLTADTYTHSSVAGWRHGDTVDQAIERERAALAAKVEYEVGF